MYPYRISNNTTASMTLITVPLHGAGIYSVILYVTLIFQTVYLETLMKFAVPAFRKGYRKTVTV
jgi:hypothetical protein